jgi:hypothetical protein
LRYSLNYLDDKHKVVVPIEVEITASRCLEGTIVFLNVVGLHNELIFGVGTTKIDAEEMLQKTLTKYFDDLMSSDLSLYRCDDLILDKEKLRRSIKTIES